MYRKLLGSAAFIDEGEGAPWGIVNLRQDFTLLDDFHIDFVLGWDSAGQDAAMQYIMLILYDMDGGEIAMLVTVIPGWSSEVNTMPCSAVTSTHPVMTHNPISIQPPSNSIAFLVTLRSVSTALRF